jgi:acetylornithine deacetylase/succinyl-diaminopimelate desuccinylase-like protein
VFDGKSISEEAAGLAFPRYPGSDGDARAIAWIEKRIEALGLETSLQRFSYDLGPARRALRSVLVISAGLVAAAGTAIPRSPITGLVLLVAAVLPSMVFLAWAPWLEKLYRRQGSTRTANVIGRRGVDRPRQTQLLMAHHDSKSQSLTFPLRMGLTVVAIVGVLALLALALAAAFSPGSPHFPWAAPAVGAAVALAALTLSTMKSGNLSPGGVDNAGSVAIMLAVAERLNQDLASDIELLVLSTGAEEDHMVGAMRWLDEYAGSISRPVFSLNFDGAGAPGRPVLIERFGFGRFFSAEMSAAARQAASRLGMNPRGIVMLPGMGIDSIPFAHRGLPCLTLSSGSLDRATMSVHSANDKAENLDPDTLAEVADLAYETMMELAATGGEGPRVQS